MRDTANHNNKQAAQKTQKMDIFEILNFLNSADFKGYIESLKKQSEDKKTFPLGASMCGFPEGMFLSIGSDKDFNELNLFFYRDENSKRALLAHMSIVGVANGK